MKTVELGFNGCDRHEIGNLYTFTFQFEKWMERELSKRVTNVEAFGKKHGKGWYLIISFRAAKGVRKASVEGPSIQRNCISDQPHHRNWSIDLPYFQFKSPNPKAYVPLIKQLLEQVAILLQREEIDPSKIQRDTKSLLKQFATKKGFLEYDPNIPIEEQEEEERAVAAATSKVVAEEKAIADCLKNLRRKYKLKFDVVFDAKEKKRRGKDWLTDYAVVDLTVALPSKKGEIPDDLYRDTLEIFRHAEKVLKRSRTFFCLRIVPDLKKQPWTVLMLLTERDLAKTHTSVREAAAGLLGLTVGNAPFKKLYSTCRHALIAYSQKAELVYAFPSEAAITFSEHFRYCDGVEQAVLSDKLNKKIVIWSGAYLGNWHYFLKDYREAIPHWQRVADAGDPEGLICIAAAHALLGNMKKAFQYAKKALEEGIPKKKLADPDFANFRRHPLFAKLKTTKKTIAEPPPKPLSPKWGIPKNLGELVKEGDGMWDDDRWSPIILTVMSNTSSRGRKIPLTWQLEFDPYVRKFKAASKRLEEMGTKPSGDGWTEVVEQEFKARYPKFVREFDSDSESSTCVVSVKSEQACRKLLELIWSMMHLTIAFP